MSVSGTTVYAKQAAMVANLLNAAESNPRLVSPPEVVAKAIGRA